MNFNNDSQINNPNSHEDNEFYDALNFSKFSKGKGGNWPNMQIQSKLVAAVNPYNDLTKATKNIKQSISQILSRQNSTSDIDNLEEVNEAGTTKKKVVKKKIIRKIIKKKNADGSEAPP